MKKLVFALTIGAVAFAANAAKINWSTGSNIMPDGKEVAGANSLTILTFALADKDAYENLSLDKIWSTYGNESIANMKTASTGNGSGEGMYGAKVSYTIQETDRGKMFYDAIITVWDKNGDGKVDMYAVNKSATEVNSSGSVVSQPNNLALKIYGTDTDVTWQSVPEPTSGLLLLLGVAGLALRRRRA